MASGTLYSWTVPSGYKTDSGTSYAGAYWFVEWSSKYISPGVSEVTWRLGKGGRSSSPTQLYTHAKLKFTSSNTLTHKTGTDCISSQYSTGKLTSSAAGDGLNCRFNNTSASVVSGTFYINHGTNGAATFTANLSVAIYAYTTFHDTAPVATLDTNYPYTRCSSPTSVTLDKTVYLPGDTVKISWSGASGGTANSISKYAVQYKLGSGTWTALQDCTSSSTTFKISSGATRGQAIYAKVKALGTISGYDATDFKESSTNAKINRIPSKPTVTVSIVDKGSDLLKIPYNGKRKIVASAGTDDDGQSYVVKYKVNNTGDYISYSQTTFNSLANSNSYTFYTYDGYEYSEGVTKSFIYNSSKPAVSVSTTGQNLDTGTNSAYHGAKSYVITPTITATRSGGQSSNNKYTYKFYAVILNSDGSVKSRTLVSTPQSSVSSTSYTPTDVRALKAPAYGPSGGYYYQFGVILNDGIENSEEKFTSPYYITGIPLCSAKNDISADNKINIKSTNTTYFSNKINLEMIANAGYSKIEVLVQSTNNSKVQSITQAKSSKEFKLDKTTRGSKYIIKVRPIANNFTPSSYETITSNLYRVQLPNLGSLTSTKPRVNPFISSEMVFKFLNFFNTSTPTETLRNQYGVGTSVTLKFTTNNKNNGTTGTFEITKSWSSLIESNAVLYYEIDNSNTNIKKLYDGLGIDPLLSSDTNILTSLSFINLYGDTISASSYYQAICYVTAGTTPQINSVTITPEYNNTAYSDAYYLPQGFKFKIDLTPSNVYHKIKKVEIAIKTNNKSNTIMTQTINTTVTVTDALKGFTIKTNSLPEIRSNVVNPIFSITIVTEANQSSTQIDHEKSCELIKLITGQGKITSAAWSQENQVDVKYEVTDPGYEKRKESDQNQIHFSARLYTDNNPLNLANYADYFFRTVYYPTTEQKPISFKAPAGWVNFKEIIVKNTINVYPIKGNTTDLAIQKVWWSSAIIIYKASPTLSYRKNKIGVNFDFSDTNNCSEAALVVSAHDSEKLVYFHSPKKTTSINLEEGCVADFIISGGSWDNTESGVINKDDNGGGSVENLAQVASTGQLSHLLQTNGDVVVFIGGSASVLI